MRRFFNLVRIDLSALAHNLREVRRLVGPGVKIMAVVKANAYGHGLLPVGEHLWRAGADALGVMDLEEAVLLRDRGVTAPVYILAGFTPQQCSEIAELNLIPFVYDPDLARELNLAGRQNRKKVKVQIKIDTGMNRLGMRPERAESFLQKVREMEHLEVTGLCTHLADADSKDSLFVREQLRLLDGFIEKARAMGYANLELNNAANSAAVIGRPEAHLDLVRPGLMLYGDWPAEHLKDKAELKPAMSVISRVNQVKAVPRGEGVSYGHTWTAQRDSVVAVAPIGYTHGYNRLLSNKGQALIRGRRAPVAGRVCMNLTMFDVTDIPGVEVGDEVVLLGRQGREVISAAELGGLMGTLSYEVFCLMGGLGRLEYIREET